MSDPLTYQQVFTFFQAQNGAVNELWKFYSAVALALLAAAVGSDKLKATKLGIGMVLGGFWLFSIANLVALVNTQSVVVDLANSLNALAPNDPSSAAIVFTPTPSWGIAIFHLVCDISLTIAIYVVAHNAWTQKPAHTEVG